MPISFEFGSGTPAVPNLQALTLPSRRMGTPDTHFFPSKLPPRRTTTLAKAGGMHWGQPGSRTPQFAGRAVPCGAAVDPSAGPCAEVADDYILYWNDVALGVVRGDVTLQQCGPTRSSRALAIVHAAMFNAANAVERKYSPYIPYNKSPPAAPPGTSAAVAVAYAAHDTLANLFSDQAASLEELLADYLARRPTVDARGEALGKEVAREHLAFRADDQSDRGLSESAYTLVGNAVKTSLMAPPRPPEHNVDPLNPQQGFLGVSWGKVRPFAVPAAERFRAPKPPLPGSPEYLQAFNEVKALGSDGVTTANNSALADKLKEKGIFWGYDSPNSGLGPPPRLYNQIVRVIATQKNNAPIDNARLFALVNLAMADAGIAAWETKYHYKYWRPVKGIREAALIPAPGGPFLLDPDEGWRPLGAQGSNQSGKDFTPPSPAYPSGHAASGSAAFAILERLYPEPTEFTFVSDELDGVTTDAQGLVRPLMRRSFGSFREVALENAESRIWLGVQWRFGAEAGMAQGEQIGQYVFENYLRPRG